MNKKTYAFGDFLLDLEQKRLLRNGQIVALQPKVFNLLVFFVERAGALISRDELMQAVWAETFVGETNLRFCIHALRKALGAGFVETVPKRGYRFIAEVSENQPAIIPAQISEDLISEETAAPPEITGKNQFNTRHWLIGVSVFSIVCLLIFAFAWQRNRVRTPRNSSGIDSLAVLPFTQIGEREIDLQAGLADAMITNLGKIKQLKILPIGAVQKFVGRDFDALTIGRELKTDAVLEGSYLVKGEDARVTARLLRVANGETLWTETFTAKKTSNLELENLISLRTARLLSLKFAETEDEKSPANVNVNAEAVRNYLAGRRIWQLRELKRREEMIRLFQRAIELAPDWSLAYSGLAEALLNEDTYSIDWKTAEQAARKALELDGANAAAHTALAQIYHRKYWDWENAEKSFQKAFEANPDYAPAHHEYGIFLGIRRRFSEAEAEMKKAIEAEPLSPFYFASLCELYSFDRRFDEALKQCDYAQNIEPDFWRTRKQLFWIYAQKRMYAEMAEMILGKASEIEKADHALTKALAENDLRSFWQSLIDERLNNPKNSASSSLAIATFYLQTGEREKALDYLEKALGERDFFLPTANADFVFDSIRGENRFVAVMQKIGLQK